MTICVGPTGTVRPEASASAYYSDEGWTIESLQDDHDVSWPGGYAIDKSWISPPPKDIEVYEDSTEAVLAAHRIERDYGIVEYGVCVAAGVIPEGTA